MITAGIGKHVESEVEILVQPDQSLIVIKTYKEVPCINWLNQHLARYYSPSRGLPVAQHEFAALELLCKCGIAPNPLSFGGDSITMEYAGVLLSSETNLSAENYRKQAQFILNLLENLHFKHNDLLSRNVLVHEDKVKIIDFTLSEFNGVELIESLPNPRWASPGEDWRLLNYLDEMRQLEKVSLRTQFRRIMKTLYAYLHKNMS